MVIYENYDTGISFAFESEWGDGDKIAVWSVRYGVPDPLCDEPDLFLRVLSDSLQAGQAAVEAFARGLEAARESSGLWSVRWQRETADPFSPLTPVETDRD